jgi:hypothetical protein
MPMPRAKRDVTEAPVARPLPLRELDHVKLIKAMSVNDTALTPGLVGTIVYCHGIAAYEVEFPGISEIFQIPADDLEKI